MCHSVGCMLRWQCYFSGGVLIVGRPAGIGSCGNAGVELDGTLVAKVVWSLCRGVVRVVVALRAVATATDHL